MSNLLHILRGEFDPRTVPNLVLWLKSTEGITLDTSTGTNTVSTWANQASTGSNWNATQSTKASQPLFVENAINGYPVLRFNGTSNFLVFASAVAKSATRNVSGLSAYIVMKSSNTSAQHQVFTVATGTNSLVSRFGIFKSSVNVLSGVVRALDGDSGGFGGGSVTDSTGYQIVSMVVDYAAPLVSFYKDGTLITTSSTGITAGNTSDTDSRVVQIGARGATAEQFFTGDIAEILFFTDDVSASGNLYLVRGLGNKYARTVA